MTNGLVINGGIDRQKWQRLFTKGKWAAAAALEEQCLRTRDYQIFQVMLSVKCN